MKWQWYVQATDKDASDYYANEVTAVCQVIDNDTSDHLTNKMTVVCTGN